MGTAKSDHKLTFGQFLLFYGEKTEDYDMLCWEI